MVSIVIASLPGPEYKETCLRSIGDFTPEEHEVVTVEVPETPGGDLAVCQAFNKGAFRAAGDPLVFLTADTVVTPSWLVNLQRCAGETGAAAVGPLCNLSPGGQNLPFDRSPQFDPLSPGPAFNKTDPSKWRQAIRIAGAPMLVSRRAFEDAGGFDERFGTGGFADDDFCLRLALRGYRCYIAGDTYVHRAGPRHSLQGEPDRVKILDAEARRICAKWRLDDPMAAHPRRDVLGMVDLKDKKVLDVKCRTGATLLECALRGAASGTGLEDDRALHALVAACFEGRADARIAGSLKDLGKETFDLILSVWQLERLPNPVYALRRYRSLLAEDGVLLAVVRNSWALSRLLPLLLTAPPPTYPRPAWGPSASPDDVLRWFRDSGLVVTAVKTAYTPQWGQEPFLDGFLRLAKKHGFLDDPKREYYSDECWFLARLPGEEPVE